MYTYTLYIYTYTYIYIHIHIHIYTNIDNYYFCYCPLVTAACRILTCEFHNCLLLCSHNKDMKFKTAYFMYSKIVKNKPLL